MISTNESTVCLTIQQDDEKPHWDDDIDIDDILDAREETSEGKKRKKQKARQADIQAHYGEVDEDQMDAEVVRSWEVEEAQWDGTEESRKRLMDKYMDEVYGLDFNDMVSNPWLGLSSLTRPSGTRQVGDLPTRFKYTTVAPSSFALDPVEILMATDKELNEYMSIKRFAPYKKNKKGTWDKSRNENLMELRKAISSRTWDGDPISEWVQQARSGGRNSAGIPGRTLEGDGTKKRKRLGKKERRKLKALSGSSHVETGVDIESETSYPQQAKSEDINESERPKKKRKKQKNVGSS